MTQERDWQRLDFRVILLDATISMLSVGILGWLLLFGNGLRGGMISVTIFVAGFLFFVGVDLSRCITTRFRISAERIELEYGLVWRVKRSIPRDRIRSVDITANPLYRIFGLAAVKLGTGQHAGNVEKDELALDAVSTQRAEELQQFLLQRTEVEPGGHQTTLASFHIEWIRYAVLGLSGFALIGAAVAALGQLLEIINVDFEAIWNEVSRIVGEHSSVTFWMTIAGVVICTFILGAILSALLYLENWSGYRLSRKTGHTLHLTRGLLFRRSVSIEERRIRGVEFSEPLQIRWARGALLRVVVSGFGQNENDASQEKSVIMPSAPNTAIDDLAIKLLNEPTVKLAGLRLRAHPKAALYRIIFRRTLAAAFVLGLTFTPSMLIHLPIWVWAIVIFLCGIIVIPSFDAYRSLGHDLRGEYLLARRGSLLRRTVALQRTGIIGWKFRQSPLQRRVNLLTITATTAAGRGAYKIVDTDNNEGIAFAQAAVPRLLEDFIDR